MKAIIVADIHGDREAVLRLRESVRDKDLDYFLLLGDYSVGFKDPQQNREDLLFLLEALKDFNVKAIPGNCDQQESLKLLDEYNASLHNTVIELPEAALMGFGGSNPTPFNTPLEFSEKEIYESLRDLMASTKKEVTILLVHFPPKDTKCDVIKNGAHVGSSSLRKIIEEHQPDLVVCSHIHESGGREDMIGKTRVVNVGRVYEGWAYLLDLNGGVNLSFYTG